MPISLGLSGTHTMRSKPPGLGCSGGGVAAASRSAWSAAAGDARSDPSSPSQTMAVAPAPMPVSSLAVAASKSARGAAAASRSATSAAAGDARSDPSSSVPNHDGRARARGRALKLGGGGCYGGGWWQPPQRRLADEGVCACTSVRCSPSPRTSFLDPGCVVIVRR